MLHWLDLAVISVSIKHLSPPESSDGFGSSAFCHCQPGQLGMLLAHFPQLCPVT